MRPLGRLYTPGVQLRDLHSVDELARAGHTLLDGSALTAAAAAAAVQPGA